MNTIVTVQLLINLPRWRTYTQSLSALGPNNYVDTKMATTKKENIVCMMAVQLCWPSITAAGRRRIHNSAPAADNAPASALHCGTGYERVIAPRNDGNRNDGCWYWERSRRPQ